MDHWAAEVEHEAITAENREAFNKHMEKFPTQADALVNHMELAKQLGVPYKLPESMEKLPDDASRTALTAAMNKLAGREVATDIEGLADLNMKIGLAEGAPGNEDLAKAFKEYVVKSGKGKKMAQSDIAFINETVSKLAIDASAKAASAKIAKATETNDALVAMPKYGSQEKLDEASEFVKRAFQHQAGLSAEQFEKVGKSLATSIFSQDPLLADAIITLVAPLGKTVKIESGDGDPKPDPKISDQDKQVAIDLGWV